MMQIPDKMAGWLVTLLVIGACLAFIGLVLLMAGA